MQETSDIFLGHQRVLAPDGVERDFYVRQLRDWKGSALVESMTPPTMALYGHLCGWTLARAHARSGDRVAIASYLGSGDTFDRAGSSVGGWSEYLGQEVDGGPVAARAHTRR
jgi:hypothetical protein